MSLARQTDLDPESATTAAARMAVFAEEVDAVWRDVAPQIEALNLARPWSDDGTGRDFEKDYLPAANDTTEAAGAIVSRLIETATSIGVASLRTEAADEESATMMMGQPR